MTQGFIMDPAATAIYQDWIESLPRINIEALAFKLLKLIPKTPTPIPASNSPLKKVGAR